MKLPREVQATLAGLILFIILSFFNWQEYTFGPYSVGRSLWHGFGIITILVAIAYLVWEIGRAMNYEVKLGEVTPGMTSAGLAIALLVCTVIVFLDWSRLPGLADVRGLGRRDPDRSRRFPPGKEGRRHDAEDAREHQRR